MYLPFSLHFVRMVTTTIYGHDTMRWF